MISNLQAELFELHIFNYLQGTDVFNLSLVNRQMHHRFSPIQTLKKLKIKPRDMWPELCISLVDSLTSMEELNLNLKELALITWKFKKISLVFENHQDFKKMLFFDAELLNHPFEVCSLNMLTDISIMAVSHPLTRNLFIPRLTKLTRLKIVENLNNNLVNQLVTFLPGSNVTELELFNAADSVKLALLFPILPKTKIHTLSLEKCRIHSPDRQVAEYFGIDHDTPFNKIKEKTEKVPYERAIRMGGVISLAVVLPNTKLRKLNLKHNPISAVESIVLISFLPESHLDWLEISGLNWRRRITQTATTRTNNLQYLMKVLSITKIRHLEYGGGLNNVWIDSFQDTFAKNSLKSAKLSISPDSLERFFSICGDLQELDLITDQGDLYCAAIQQSIEVCKIKSLSLHGLTNTGFETLISKLDYSDLTRLDISHSNIDDGCIASLGIYLPLTKLEHLSLCNCRFGDPGLNIIGQILKYTRLEYIDFRKNQNTVRGMNDFALRLRANVRQFDDYEFKSRGWEVLLGNPTRKIVF
ncbi:hypothetical protein HK103_000801 [Boothiomyces macroporosus]|uniref:RNI-like protein n=1 Tax=Boothiomyces macroporosus TaxID=261099 RepID=A0AAD5UB31_9FUNG|nr:hypothetical protein HK103_000801 [Boothiomyces macroporosus]